jgi:hypothetical protein
VVVVVGMMPGVEEVEELVVVAGTPVVVIWRARKRTRSLK